MLNPEILLASSPGNLPRYTSYPTAPHFAPDPDGIISKLLVTEARASPEISVYLHIPFCDRLCWFCGCHTKQTLRYALVGTYVDHLVSEIQLASRAIGTRPLIRNLHLGGGSPSMLKAIDFQRLRSALEQLGRFDETSEISVEIDPSDRNNDLLAGLQTLGITRGSIGVQDFSPEVQVAINRIQSVDDTMTTISDLRSIGVKSINVDILYGLPKQSEERLLSTVAEVVALAPERVALFGYAHVPWLKKHQSMIADADLPDDRDRLRHAALAATNLFSAGYERVGFDHFAKPGDSLAVAAREGELHRNFQGYTTDGCSVLLGFGASSISRCSSGFLQNIVSTTQYEASVQSGRLPHARGIALTKDDQIRGWIIEQLMCDLVLRKDKLSAKFPDGWESYWQMAEDAHEALPLGLTGLTNNALVVHEEGRNFLRLVAAQFDAYLGSGAACYSKAS